MSTRIVIPDSISPHLAAVTIAVLGGARTVREVSMATGRSLQPTHRALRKARDAGLVSWEDGKAGTLRSALGVAAVGCHTRGH